jgi:hypothetical protein
MAITQSQSTHHVHNIALGRYKDTGTAAAFTITTGFKPRYVKVMNVDGLCMEEWYEGMADASAVKTVDSGSNATDVIKITSNGITVSASGFTVGLDTDINVSSEQLSWIAMG